MLLFFVGMSDVENKITPKFSLRYSFIMFIQVVITIP